MLDDFHFEGRNYLVLESLRIPQILGDASKAIIKVLASVKAPSAALLSARARAMSLVLISESFKRIVRALCDVSFPLIEKDWTMVTLGYILRTRQKQSAI
jgi:hypothetical protein